MRLEPIQILKPNVPIVSSDNDTAGTGLLTLLDEVDIGETFAAVRSAQLLGEFVIANAASVNN